jgi:DNA-directed RNA polymerase II subunit RPB1
MGGREGIIDTAVKTADVGYIQRRLVKAMESVMGRYDSTLRNARGCVMQFLYGEDGMDAQRIEFQRFDSYTLSEEEFRNRYFFNLSSPRLGELPWVSVNNEPMYYMTKELIENCRRDIELRILFENEYKQLVSDRVRLREILACRGSGSETDPDIYLPVNLDRLIWNVQREFGINLDEPTALHPRRVMELVQSLCKAEITMIRGDDPLSREAQENATLLFQIHLRSKLSTRRVIEYYRLSEEALISLKGYIINEFNAAIVNPGEMCGVLAAQSLGEPATRK